MKNLKAFVIVLASILVSFCFMSFKIQGIDNAREENIILYIIIGASVVIIFLFLFFALQSNKSELDSLSSSSSDDTHNTESQVGEA